MLREHWVRAHGLGRLFAPDALRGLIIVLMALDHANIFIAHKHSSGEYWGGAFPVYNDALAFLTRFVTHFCAPGFFLLMGAGMALFAHSRQERGWTRAEIIGHFLIRGAALILLQLLVVNRAWALTPGGWGIQIYIGVLSALGVNMILCSLMLWLKPVYLLGLTGLLVVGMELLVPDPSLWGPGMSLPTLLFLLPGGISGSGGKLLLWSNYPALQWLELATFGIVFGRRLVEDPSKAFGRAWKLGMALLMAFFVVRYLDGFGNIRPRLSDSWIDFLNPVKYPPSLTFTLMTTGTNLIILWLFSRAGEWARRVIQPLVVFGQVPLFFYVLHLFLYAALGYWLTPGGTSIPAMYPLWLFGLLILFPLCLWYRQFKHRQPLQSVLQYL
jgi:uncharacterized membrane protein